MTVRRRIASLLALALAVLPWLGAVLAAEAATPRDAILLCTVHGPVLVRLDPATGEVQEVPAAPAGSSHLCCLVSIACGAATMPGATPVAQIQPALAGSPPLPAHQAAPSADLAQRVAANPVRGPPSSPHAA